MWYIIVALAAWAYVLVAVTVNTKSINDKNTTK